MPTRQVAYGRIAQLLGSSRTEVATKMLNYGIPCPALVRELTPDEQQRIVQIRNARAQSQDDFAIAVITFVREVWGNC